MGLNILYKVDPALQVEGEDWDILFWHNDKLLTAGYANGTISIWNRDLKLLNKFTAHEYSIYHICSGFGTTFYTTSNDCTIKHWDEDKTNDKQDFILLHTIDLEGQVPVRRLRFDLESKRLYSGDELGQIKIWTEDGSLQGILETMEEIWDMILYKKDEIITCRHLDLILHSITEKDNKIRSYVKNTMAGHGPMLIIEDKLCFVQKDTYTILVNEMDKPGNPNLAKLIGHTALINTMKALNKDILISGGGDNKLIVWDLQNFKSIEEIRLDGYINDLVVHPEQGIIFVGGQNKMLIALKF